MLSNNTVDLGSKLDNWMILNLRKTVHILKLLHWSDDWGIVNVSRSVTERAEVVRRIGRWQVIVNTVKLVI